MPPRRAVDVERVAELIRDVARAELLPRFASIGGVRATPKPSAEDPGDIVTDADEAVERLLSAELASLLPRSAVVGEEATARDARVRDALDRDGWAWVIDPLDGTKNFAAGQRAFGTMVTLCRDGDAVAAWIHLPTEDSMLTAESGAGAWDGGRRVPCARLDGVPRGTVFTRFMSAELRERVESRAAGGTRRAKAHFSAAWEYAALLRGEKDFNLYWRLLPWDHAPGALMLAESGGALRHGDGRPYRAADRDPLGLAVRDTESWEPLRERLLGD